MSSAPYEEASRREGIHFKTATASDAKACSDACRDDPLCQSWSRLGSSTCFLNLDAPASVGGNAEDASGIKLYSDFTLSDNSTLWGAAPILKKFSTRSIALCKHECAITEACVAFTYAAQFDFSATCLLFNEVGPGASGFVLWSVTGYKKKDTTAP